jgi:class 3 adenylate cyclase
MKFGLSGGARAKLAGFSPTPPLGEHELRGFEGKVEVFRLYHLERA